MIIGFLIFLGIFLFLAMAVRWYVHPDRCKVSGKVHDYPISVEGEPWHMVALTCRHCGDKFGI